MIRQSEFKRKYDSEMGKYAKQHIWNGERSIYGEGIFELKNFTVKSFFKKPTPKRKPPQPPPPKKVTFADKKVGDKIVKILFRENPPTTKKTTHKKMTEKEYSQYMEGLRKLYNY